MHILGLVYANSELVLGVLHHPLDAFVLVIDLLEQAYVVRCRALLALQLLQVEEAQATQTTDNIL